MRAVNDNARQVHTSREVLTREALHDLECAYRLFSKAEEYRAGREVAGALARILARPLGGLPTKGDWLA
jgi:hypothetical protein